MSRHLHGLFAGVDWLPQMQGRNFYIVGGAWRTLARYHIATTGHPLNIIHNYKISRDEMAALIADVTSKSEDELRRVPQVQSSRVGTIHTAALIMNELLQTVRPKSFIFSAYGLREGMLFSELKKPVRKRDPLLEACRDMAAKEGRFAEHGEEIFTWLRPVFDTISQKGQRLALAAATLSDIAWAMNGDYRAAQAFRRIFRAPFSGVGHRGRAIIALAVFARYRGNLVGHAAEDGLALVSDEEKQMALTLGLTLRLSHSLSGGTMGILSRTALNVTATEIVLRVPEELSVMVGVHVMSRLKSVADSIGKTASIKIVKDLLS
jgi:exopolyphosphatase/guanosine-5'-triphosphate,3'-diphosphate pyrophosphatase